MPRIIINPGPDNEIVLPMSEFIEGLMSSMERKTPKEKLRESLLNLRETGENYLGECRRLEESDLKALPMRTE